MFIVRVCHLKADTTPRDIKNLSPHYPAMLMARSLTELLSKWDADRQSQLASSLPLDKVV